MSEKTVTFGASDSLSTEPASYIRSGPERQTSNPAKRKQTLLALLSELTDLRDTEELEREVKDSIPTSGDSPQDDSSREGVALFRAFDRQANNLDRKLQSFANAVRQLGSSVGLLNATYHLRGALIQIQFLFQDNAAELFTEIRRVHVEAARSSISSPNKPLEQDQLQPKCIPERERVRERDRVHTGMRPQVKPIHNLELFPEEMRKLAKQIQVFVDRLNDIPEFTDELVNISFSSFASDLEYRASCLAEFKGQIRTVAVQRYINDLSADIGSHMERMQEALTAFVDVGVPYIQHAQNHTADGLQYLSAVATFFSGVTATTIQYSFDQTGNTLADLVNALWLISLIFSIASAINSQLAYHWRAAMYRSPRRYVPWWVAIWIKRSPLFFLIGSVIAFSIGLCVFTYSSNQGRVVSALVTTFTIVTSSGLISVGLWFASERWTFSRTRGQRWLFDILSDTQDQVNKALGITWIIQHWPENAWMRLASWTRVQIHNITVGLATFFALCTCRTRPEDEEEQTHRSAFIPGQYPRPSSSRPDFDGASITETIQSAPGPGSPRFSEKNGRRLPVSDSMASISVPSSSGHVQNANQLALGSAAHSRTAGNEAGIVERPRPQRLKSVVERIIAMNRATGGKSPSRSRAESDMATGGRRPSADDYAATSFPQKARIQALKPGLANLQITQFLNEHMALVKHMQFSPNGDFLATCSWDRTAIIWKIGSTVELCLKLYHPISTGGFVNQVAWSPDGESLLTRTQKAIKVWNPRTGLGQRAINRGRSIQSAAWMPSGNGFLSVEYVSQRSTDSVLATNLVRLASDGQVLETHKLDRIQVWDTAIMADEDRVLAVGTLLKTTDHLQPTKSRPEKRLFVYNMKTREVEHHVPLLQEVRNITLSTKTGQSAYALVSNENKSPPQMWRIDMKKGVKAREQVARLILVHSYLTKTPVDFAGQSYFGGPNDTFVCCSSRSGEIFIWDRTSATLLHTLRPEDSEVIKNFTCNHKAAPEFMLVSGALDGTLRIWSSAPTPSPFATPDRQMTTSPEPQSSMGSVTPPQRGASLGSSISAK